MSRNILEPSSICEYRAGERIAWNSCVVGTRHTGVIHTIHWMTSRIDGYWVLGVWIDGEDHRQTKKGHPRLHYFPLIGAVLSGIEKVLG